MRRLFLHAVIAVSPAVAFALASPAPRVLAAPPPLPAPAASACEALNGLKIADTTIKAATAQPAGTFTPPGAANGRGGRGMADMPSFCRVEAVARPTPTSNIQFEVWLPAEGWNGKLQVVGNGGLAGTIGYAAMATALRAGFATASTDTGHTATEPATWMADRERLIDYSSRGLHLTTVDAKSMVQAYYTAQAKQSYYTGCSTGGKQGLMEAQRYPDDFDGILAGDAANFWTHQMASETWNGVVTSAPDAHISNEKLQMLENATVKACDMLDGAADGLVSDPMHCKFDPATLLCPAGTADGPSCLTAPQVAAVKKLYGGVTDQRGRKVYPGFWPGGEVGWGARPGAQGALGLPTVINRTEQPGGSAYSFWGNAFFHDAKWPYPNFDFDQNIDRADSLLAPITNATNPDLEPFRKAGHKLIYYHGAADPLIPAQNGIDYYESVVKAQKSADKTQEFYRAFLVPGLYHCSGGPGPIAFNGNAPAGQRDADHDALLALERWVEQGKAPEKIIGTKYVDGNASNGVAFQRPLCPYPQVAKYKGTGDMKDAANFACAVVK